MSVCISTTDSAMQPLSPNAQMSAHDMVPNSVLINSAK